MSLRVLHAVNSMDRKPGSVSIALDGLVHALSSAGIHSDIAEQASAAEVRDHVNAADIVHIHGAEGAFPYEVAAAARRAQTACVLSPLGSFCANPFEKVDWLSAWKNRASQRRLLSWASVVTAMNEEEASSISRLDRSAAVTVLPYGLTFDEYGSTAADSSADALNVGDQRCLLYLGPIHPVEGLVPLLRAVAELGHDFIGWRLVLAGPEPGVWRGKLEAALARKRALDRVVFVSDPDLRTQRMLLVRASVLVSVPLRTRCPVSVCQAVAAGVPVVASPHGVFDECASAVRLCRSDGPALRDALRPLIICDDDTRRAEGERGRASLRERLDWPVLVKRYVETYRAAARRRGGVAATKG